MAQPMAYVPLSGELSVERLAALAAEFDEIEPGATYRAAEFVTWIGREVRHRQAVDAEKRRAFNARPPISVPLSEWIWGYGWTRVDGLHAQSGPLSVAARVWGSGGRRFESFRPDQHNRVGVMHVHRSDSPDADASICAIVRSIAVILLSIASRSCSMGAIARSAPTPSLRRFA